MNPNGQRPWRWLLLPLLAVACASLLPWDRSTADLAAGWQRLVSFAAAFVPPDLSSSALHRAFALTLDTVAIAVLAMALALLLAVPLALGGSRTFAGSSTPTARLLRTACRVVLAVMRGIPDFAWVLMLVGFTGLGVGTGILGLALHTAGWCGKVLGEQWDLLPPERHEAVRATGGSRLATFCYGVLPLSTPTVLRFLLLRAECVLRNASVIGVVGGGGLGSSLWEAFQDSDHRFAATLLLVLLALTGLGDLASSQLRRLLAGRLRDPVTTRARRWLAGVGALLLLVGAGWHLGPELRQMGHDLGSLDLGSAGRFAARLLSAPDPTAIPVAVREAMLPLGVAFVCTLAATLLAGALAIPASARMHHHQPQRLGRCTIVAVRSLALLWRAIPEVAWLLVFAILLRQGLSAAVLAITVHSTGVLLRAFVESLDELPPHQLERAGPTTKVACFAYAAMPSLWPTWRGYALLQFEGNLRTGIVLGMIGAGGLGEAFDGNLRFDRLERASTFLWAMVLLSVLVDAAGRWLGLRRRC